jgi:ankyrin repeat protein
MIVDVFYGFSPHFFSSVSLFFSHLFSSLSLYLPLTPSLSPFLPRPPLTHHTNSIKDGAYVNIQSHGGWTPLIFASAQGHLKEAQEIIQLGANTLF